VDRVGAEVLDDVGEVPLHRFERHYETKEENDWIIKELERLKREWLERHSETEEEIEQVLERHYKTNNLK
jgi:hypothetical protein